jgi:Cu(I)/Ag(I) efflux system membrane protein CusA/SilA
LFDTILKASREVGGAVLTAVSTTIISFLPVFTMEGAEGKLFKPLAFTKTFALFSSLIVALVIIPPVAHWIYSTRPGGRKFGWVFFEGLIYLGGVLMIVWDWKLGLAVALVGAYRLLAVRYPILVEDRAKRLINLMIALVVTLILAAYWMPLGPGKGLFRNFIFLSLILGVILLALRIFQQFYEEILNWCLDHKAVFLCIPLLLLVAGAVIWQGYATVFGWFPRLIHESAPGKLMARSFPGIGREFMPPLDEGAYLFMPTTMPHASIGEVLDILQRQNRALEALPEVENVVGKLGRAETALDPAPVSMIETLITYRSEFLNDRSGRPRRFRCDPDERDFFRSLDGEPVPAMDGNPYVVRGRFDRDEHHRLIPDPNGMPFRLWRPPLDPRLNPGREAWHGIRKPDDIWERIVEAGSILGSTAAPKLQPISARMVMLQSGIRANMGVKVYGPDLGAIETVARSIEKFLRKVPSIDPATVIADRIIGKPYLEIEIDRRAIAQYGIDLQQVQDVIEIAIGGKEITTTVEGRERYPVRVRYLRELRDDIESIAKVLVTSRDGKNIPLIQLAKINYIPGPQVIKGENTFQVGYVLFDGKPGFAETNVVEDAREYLVEKIETGDLELPTGVSFSFTGNYENQVRSDKKLRVILPLALLVILIILYIQFRSFAVSAFVFSGIAVAWAGGFILIWLYGQPWFLDFSVFGTNMRDLFQVHPINLSVATWVGFLALFGIASDDGVIMATNLNHAFSARDIRSIEDIRRTTVKASLHRVRPCLMTTATTILALIPVLASTGRGSDIMVPMAIPSFGGMVFEIATMLVVPVLYCWMVERRCLRERNSRQEAQAGFEPGILAD